MAKRARLNRFDTAVPKWPRETLASRLATCIAMLVIHGIATDKEKQVMRSRLTKSVLADRATREAE